MRAFNRDEWDTFKKTFFCINKTKIYTKGVVNYIGLHVWILYHGDKIGIFAW